MASLFSVLSKRYPLRISTYILSCRKSLINPAFPCKAMRMRNGTILFQKISKMEIRETSTDSATLADGSEFESDSAPNSPRSAGSVKGRVLDGEFVVYVGKWPCDEITFRRESGRPQLRRREITPVEQIVNAYEQLYSLAQLIPRAEISDGVTGGLPIAEVINAIRLVQIVFVTSRVRVRKGPTSRNSG